MTDDEFTQAIGMTQELYEIASAAHSAIYWADNDDRNRFLELLEAYVQRRIAEAKA